MMKLKDYTCPGCGGVLIVDKAVKVYRCQFCGVTYDYNYFMGDDVLDRAYSYLKHKEFKAAREAFEFILQKEPHNAIAYRGLILVHAGVTDIGKLRDMRVIETFPYMQLEEVVERALINVTDDDRKIFEEFKKLLENGKRYKAAKKLQDQTEDLAKDKDKTADAMYMKAEEKKDGKKAIIVLETVLFVIGLLVILGIAGSFLIKSYRCKVSDTLMMTRGFVLDEENDGSVRNEADWDFIMEHEGGKNIGHLGKYYPNTFSKEKVVSIYLKDGQKYFNVILTIEGIVCVLFIGFQLLRIIKHNKKIKPIYDQAKVIETEAEKDNERFVEYRKDATSIAKDISKNLMVILQVDPMAQ